MIDNVDDDDIDEGGTNSQSIIILAECEGKKLLLPGDSTPKKLCDALQSYNKTNGTPLELDFMKLPHHGSTRNVTKNILNEVTCSNFIISTKKNNKYYFPNKETIAKLIRYRDSADKAINVYFNYQESLDVLGITAEELTENNINPQRLAMNSTFDIRSNCVKIKADIKGRGLQFRGSGVLYPLDGDDEYDYIFTAQHIFKDTRKKKLNAVLDKIGTIEIEVFEDGHFVTYKTITKDTISILYFLLVRFSYH